jgi:hypothetical protein
VSGEHAEDINFNDGFKKENSERWMSPSKQNRGEFIQEIEENQLPMITMSDEGNVKNSVANGIE